MNLLLWIRFFKKGICSLLKFRVLVRNSHQHRTHYSCWQKSKRLPHDPQLPGWTGYNTCPEHWRRLWNSTHLLAWKPTVSKLHECTQFDLQRRIHTTLQWSSRFLSYCLFLILLLLPRFQISPMNFNALNQDLSLLRRSLSKGRCEVCLRLYL